jgi:hypothetical protein
VDTDAIRESVRSDAVSGRLGVLLLGLHRHNRRRAAPNHGDRKAAGASAYLEDPPPSYSGLLDQKRERVALVKIHETHHEIFVVYRGGLRFAVAQVVPYAGAGLHQPPEVFESGEIRLVVH